MKRQIYLSLMESKFPLEYLTYIDAKRVRNRCETVEVLQRMIDLTPKSEKELPFGIKLGLDHAQELYYKGENALSLSQADGYLKKAAKTGDDDILADAEYLMGWLLVREHRSDEAISYLKKCIALSEKNGIILLILNAYIELAHCADENQDIQYELEILLKAERMARKAKAPIQELHIMLTISTLYNDIVELKKSLNYMERAIARLRRIKENKQLYALFTNLLNDLEPQIIIRYALICYRHGKFDEAIQTARQVEFINFKALDAAQVLYIVAALSCFEQGEDEKGLEYVRLGLSGDITYCERPYTDVFLLCYRLEVNLLERNKPELVQLLLQRIEKSILSQSSARYGRIFWKMKAVYLSFIGDKEGQAEALDKYLFYAESFIAEKDEAFNRGIRNQIKLAEELERSEREKDKQQRKLKTAVADMEYQSDHDGLTELNNRNKLNKDKLSQQFKEMKTCGVIYFDVNELKITNDVFGHEVGDKLLVDLAKSLKRYDNERYHAYRMGGDEFMLIIRDCSEEELNSAYEKWQEGMARHNSRANIRCVVAAGCAYGSGDINLDELIRTADERMYDNKRAIKNLESKVYGIG